MLLKCFRHTVMKADTNMIYVFYVQFKKKMDSATKTVFGVYVYECINENNIYMCTYVHCQSIA